MRKHAIEGHATGQRQSPKPRISAEVAVTPHQVCHAEGLALGDMQGLRQPAVVGPPQQHAHQGQKPKNGVPIHMHKQEAAHQRCNGRCGTKKRFFRTISGRIEADLSV
jgi:hypothetical protein